MADATFYPPPPLAARRADPHLLDAPSCFEHFRALGIEYHWFSNRVNYFYCRKINNLVQY